MKSALTYTGDPVNGRYSSSFQNGAFYQSNNSLEHGFCRTIGNIDFISKTDSTNIANNSCKASHRGCHGKFLYFETKIKINLKSLFYYICKYM